MGRSAQRHFRSEKEQLVADIKASVAASMNSSMQSALAAEPGQAKLGGGWASLRRSFGGKKGDSAPVAMGKPGAVPTRSDGSVWVAPKSAGRLMTYEESRQEETEAADGSLDATGTLLRLLWMNPSFDVLRCVLRLPRGLALFREFIEPHSKRDLVGLNLWQQVHRAWGMCMCACMRLVSLRTARRSRPPRPRGASRGPASAHRPTRKAALHSAPNSIQTHPHPMPC